MWEKARARVEGRRERRRKEVGVLHGHRRAAWKGNPTKPHFPGSWDDPRVLGISALEQNRLIEIELL